MIRAAAKNHDDVAVVVEPQDYQAVLDELAANKGATTLALRRRLAAKAYARTAAYDAAISNWFARAAQDRRAGFPRLRRPADPVAALRRKPAPDRRVLSQRPTSGPASPPRGSCRARNCPTTTSTTPMRPMNASASSMPARTAACVIVKHANPCGVAEGADLARRLPQGARLRLDLGLRRHRRVNRTLDADAARAITEIFTEVIIAPDATDEAIAIIAAKKNLRLLLAGGLPDPRAIGLTAKTVAGGLLVQSRDNAVVDDMELKVVTKRAPTDAELRDLQIRLPRRQARQVEHHRLRQGPRHRRHRRRPDEPGRFRAHRRAQGAGCRGRMKLAEPLTKGSVVASDAFFPFADGMLACDRGRRHRRDPARRLDARRRGDQGRRRARHRHGVHRRAAFPALNLYGMTSLAVMPHTNNPRQHPGN